MSTGTAATAKKDLVPRPAPVPSASVAASDPSKAVAFKGPTIADLAPIKLNAENDKPNDDQYWVAMTWMPARQTKMHNPSTKQVADVDMTFFKVRRYFHKTEKEEAEKYVEDMRVAEKYFFHMLTVNGEWTGLLTDEKAAEKVGMKFAYSRDQPVLKEVMEGYYKSIQADRAELAEYIHEENETTEMWRTLSAMEHDASKLSIERKKKEKSDDDDALAVKKMEQETMERVARLKKYAERKKATQKRNQPDNLAKDVEALDELQRAFS